MKNLGELSTYEFDLPEHLIAQAPAKVRHESRLLVLDRKTGAITHTVFKEIGEFLKPSDVLVANNTKVLRARLVGSRLRDEGGKWVKGGKVEFLLLARTNDPLEWEGAFHASVKHRPGIRFSIPSANGEPLLGEIVRGASDSPSGTVVARFNRDPLSGDLGEVPFPPYIRDHSRENQDRYETTYAKVEGSAAAPTAGFHFSEELIDQLKNRGMAWEELTLNVGLGTFRPVKTDQISDHVMHEESFHIDPEVAARIQAAKKRAQRVVAIGTTSVRALETAWDGNALRTGDQVSRAFFYPGGPQSIRLVDAMVTNFHLPGSTLLMLVASFAGLENTLNAYRVAIEKEYRFYSFGDAMLIL